MNHGSLEGFPDDDHERYVTFRELRRILSPLHRQIEEIHMAVSDLEAAQAAEQTEIAQVISDQATEASFVAEALANLKKQVEEGAPNVAAIEAATTRSAEHAASLKTLDDALKAQGPPAPAPSPEG